MNHRPLVVLVHGTRFDARCWAGYAERLPQADVVAVDLPGHGRRGGEPYTTAAALAIVEQAVSAAGAPTAGAVTSDASSSGAHPGARPVVLVGHSLGGYVATTYAQQHPDALAGLVLIGATADPSRHPRLRGIYSGFARVLPVIGAERMTAIANRVMVRAGLHQELLPDATGYAATPAAWAAVMAEARAEQLAEVSCPIHLVAGQFDQLGIDLRSYAAAARCAPTARTHVIPRATHLVALTHPAAVAGIIAQALPAPAGLPD